MERHQVTSNVIHSPSAILYSMCLEWAHRNPTNWGFCPMAESSKSVSPTALVKKKTITCCIRNLKMPSVFQKNFQKSFQSVLAWNRKWHAIWHIYICHLYIYICFMLYIYLYIVLKPGERHWATVRTNLGSEGHSAASFWSSAWSTSAASEATICNDGMPNLTNRNLDSH